MVLINVMFLLLIYFGKMPGLRAITLTGFIAELFLRL